MFSRPDRPEIDHRTTRLLVGLIALLLASVASLLSGTPPIESVSASYHSGGLARDVFVGCLFAISAFLLSYNGRSRREMVLSKIAALAALFVAIFPCGCDVYDEIVPYVHWISAAVMFLILAFFCFSFRRRAREKKYDQAQRRSAIYLLCGVAILGAMAVLALDALLDGSIARRIPRLTFHGENVALVAFGVAWLTASKVLPVISHPDERVISFTSGR